LLYHTGSKELYFTLWLKSGEHYVATKDYYPADTEWEVIEVVDEKLDKNYKVKAALRTKTGVVNFNTVREVRTPYKPRIGQLIKLSRQDA